MSPLQPRQDRGKRALPPLPVQAAAAHAHAAGRDRGTGAVDGRRRPARRGKLSRCPLPIDPGVSRRAGALRRIADKRARRVIQAAGEPLTAFPSDGDRLLGGGCTGRLLVLGAVVERLFHDALHLIDVRLQTGAVRMPRGALRPIWMTGL